MLLQPNISVIKNRKNILGFIDRRNKPYIFGFTNRQHANVVSQNISKDPSCYLMRSVIHDVANDINKGLTEFGISSDFNNFTIDVDAKLTIMKSKLTFEQCMEQEIEVEDMDYGDFLMTPITKTIGVVMAIDLITNDQSKFEFSGQVIDPLDDLKILRSNLREIYEKNE